MKTLYIGSNTSNHWQKTNAKTLSGAKALATKEFGIATGGKLEVAELTNYGYEQVAVKYGFDKWQQR